MDSNVSHTIEGVLGGDLEIGSFITGTGQPRLWVRTRERDGHTSVQVTLDGVAFHALLGCLTEAWKDAGVKGCLQALEPTWSGGN